MKKVWIGVGIVLVLLLGSFFVFRPRLTLHIIPLQEKIKIEEEIEVDVSRPALDIESKIVPGQLFETREEKWGIFQSTGDEFEGEKAGGTILVYNAFSPPSPVRLREETRFLSSEGGKVFCSPDKIYLPAATIKSGKVVPSVTEIKVVAQEVGEDYNIGPSKFSIPGLSGTALYYTIWAESGKEMAGGVKRQVKKVTAEDLQAAKTALQNELKQLAKSSIEKKLPLGFTLEGGAVFEQDSKISCLQEEGAKVPEFNCQGGIKAEGLAVKLEDLETLAHQFVRANVLPSKKLVPQSLNLGLSPKGTITEGGRMIFALIIEGKIYEEVNQDMLRSQIQGLEQGAIKETLSKDYPQIGEVQFKFWPPFVKKAPDNPHRIRVALTF